MAEFFSSLVEIRVIEATHEREGSKQFVPSEFAIVEVYFRKRLYRKVTWTVIGAVIIARYQGLPLGEAHYLAGHITKEDAKEISGLEDHEFEKAYAKASDITEKVMQAEGQKMDKFLEHFAEEINQWTEHFGGKLFK